MQHLKALHKNTLLFNGSAEILLSAKECITHPSYVVA
jgi:hypothetical protein